MVSTDPIKLLSELVAIDSQSHVSNKPIIDLLASWFPDQEQTIETWTRDSDGLQGENLIVKIPGKSSEHSIVFVNHMDTVPTSENWETNPFKLEEKEGKLYGLGTCDTKGGVASLIEAVKSLTEQPQYDTYLVFDGDEEVDSTGACKFLKKYHIPNAHYIFLEPTDQELCIAQRALLKVDITTYGIATHSSQATPENNAEGNAIFKMSKILELLRKDAEEIASEKHPHLNMTTQNFGVIQGGTARNVLADKTILKMERRLLPHRDPREEFARLKKHILDVVPDAAVHLDEAAPGFATDESEQIVQQVLKLTKTILPHYKIGAFQAWSEAGIFAEKGDVLVIGPGSLVGQAHRANEFISREELLQFVEVFQAILTRIQL